jgi:aspartate/methionine/tyrosine aminotransferase
VPAGFTSEEWAALVLEQVDVSFAPGTAFGPHGEGYVRISIARPTERVREAMQRLRSLRL